MTRFVDMLAQTLAQLQSLFKTAAASSMEDLNRLRGKYGPSNLICSKALSSHVHPF